MDFSRSFMIEIGSSERLELPKSLELPRSPELPELPKLAEDFVRGMGLL
jgi:hypothetical protein